MTAQKKQKRLLELEIALERFLDFTGLEEEVTITNQELKAVTTLIALAKELDDDLETVLEGHIIMIKRLRPTNESK